MPQGKTYRVIQWATGNIGSRALRAVIEHPNLELAGLWVSSAEKDGKDAGELCGLAPVGITATRSAEDLIALDADCVLYMRQGTDWDEICAILESGKNIITTRGDFHYPAMIDPENRARVDAACIKGNTSIYSTGSSPGFISEAMTIPLLSLARRHDMLTIDEFADCSSRDSPEMLFHIMGFGQPMAPFDQRRAEHLKGDFGSTLSQIAAAIGLPFDEIEAKGELSAARNTIQIAAGRIEAGTVGAMRTTITGLRHGKPVLRFRANWYVTTDIEDADWNLRDSGWRVRTEGDTPLLVDIHFPVPEEDYAAFTPGLTAHRPVNAIPMVCEAAPGIRTTVDLPHVIPQFA
ncbi:NAD(P)H-dependent amine dehydrogenase family protein [Novosphingobium album (ex Liu et al. 2023)]|uniref:Dihydrodipicolinate reductase n=1 Tax=Novosphingobium album (ex Liu et al. 2023) TaxID=3031130 RepID=A0ABT5WU76_9SPHN|nr:dihydrodipicolinate reductase [Novosphingobium album (ex Liu et al. 2023)]MDE8653455.1 dihydrodipicolinate reductase [Novosphingobium album (ex Liu et al. 2023)]